MAFHFWLSLLISCVLGEDVAVIEADEIQNSRQLKEVELDVDLTQFVGVRVLQDNSMLTFGKKSDIKFFRLSSGILQIVAPKGIEFVTPSLKTIGKGAGSDLSSEFAAMKKMLADIGLSSNVASIKDVVCKPGWKDKACLAPCTNAGDHEFYSSTGCATTKCKVDLKLGFYYAPRTQHSLKNPDVDPGCKQIACTNKNSRQVYIPGAKGNKCNTQTCATNTYISGNKCVKCPDGSTCDGTAKAPVKCDKAKYIKDNKCLSCPANHKCDGKNAVSQNVAKWVKGPNGKTCDQVCGSIDAKCDINMQSSLTSNAKVGAAFKAAGYNCKGYHGARGYAGTPFSTGRGDDCAPMTPGSKSVCNGNSPNHAALCYCRPKGGKWVKGPNGKTCDQVCGGMGKKCDINKQSSLTSNAKVGAAFKAAGYNCKGYHGARGYAGTPFSTGRGDDCAPMTPGSKSVCNGNSPNHAALCYCV